MSLNGTSTKAQYIDLFLEHAHSRRSSKCNPPIIKDENGREIIMTYRHEGDFFREMGLLDVEARSLTAWVKAKADCKVAEIIYVKFLERVKDDPRLLYNIFEQMSLRLRNTT
jgi:CRP/FNR family cyclic AMP-dependent transcriptional regulator